MTEESKQVERCSDKTARGLAWTVVVSSVLLALFVLLTRSAMDPTQQSLIGVVLGYLFGEAKLVLSYYFGSSAGSARKDELLAQSDKE